MLGGMGMGMNGISPHAGRPEGPGGMGDRPGSGMDFPGQDPGGWRPSAHWGGIVIFVTVVWTPCKQALYSSFKRPSCGLGGRGWSGQGGGSLQIGTCTCACVFDVG